MSQAWYSMDLNNKLKSSHCGWKSQCTGTLHYRLRSTSPLKWGRPFRTMQLESSQPRILKDAAPFRYVLCKNGILMFCLIDKTVTLKNLLVISERIEVCICFVWSLLTIPQYFNPNTAYISITAKIHVNNLLGGFSDFI